MSRATSAVKRHDSARRLSLLARAWAAIARGRCAGRRDRRALDVMIFERHEGLGRAIRIVGPTRVGTRALITALTSALSTAEDFLTAPLK